MPRWTCWPGSEHSAQSFLRCRPVGWADKLQLELRTKRGWAGVPFGPRPEEEPIGASFMFGLGSFALVFFPLWNGDRRGSVATLPSPSPHLFPYRFSDCISCVCFCKRLLQGHMAERFGKLQVVRIPTKLYHSAGVHCWGCSSSSLLWGRPSRPDTFTNCIGKCCFGRHGCSPVGLTACFTCNWGQEANPLQQELPGSYLPKAKGLFAIFNNHSSEMFPRCSDFYWGRDIDRETLLSCCASRRNTISLGKPNSCTV